MDSVNPIVVDISSDEEVDKTLECLDKKPKIIGHRKSKPVDPRVEDDDDCVVLDGDPYKTTANEKGFDTFEIDEVLVVGQKGEIACRDFPHPRHACAEYPFNSTSHNKYCKMCHCYVCDTRAPCAFWCVGIPSIDHCHANDKDQIWKTQRECIRTGNVLPRPVSIKTQPCFPLTKQVGIRPCSNSTRVATRPNVYVRPGYRTEQSRTFPQNHRPPAAYYNGNNPSPQVVSSNPAGYYNGNPSPQPQVVSPNPLIWTQRPISSRPVYRPHNIAQGSQYQYPPPPQRIVNGYISTVPDSNNRVYARQFSQNMYSVNAQTSAVPSVTPHPPPSNLQQQQQPPGRSTDKRFSDFEDWLMDNNSTTDPFFPLSGQGNASTLPSDYETSFGGKR